MIDQRTVDEAARRLLEAAPAGSGVILFGSHARGEAGEDSDLDFLVVEPVVKSVHQEMVRLRGELRGLRVPADVLVVSRAQFEYWSETPNTVYYQAATEGRVYGQVA